MVTKSLLLCRCEPRCLWAKWYRLQSWVIQANVWHISGSLLDTVLMWPTWHFTPWFYFPYQVPIPSKGLKSSGVSFERPPSILVPLKVHAPPKGYQLYMTCAVRGCPTPTVSWYLDDVCINFDKDYYITNSFGVCSIYILRVRSKDSGVYKVVAVNSFGQAQCSTKLAVRGRSSLQN